MANILTPEQMKVVQEAIDRRRGQQPDSPIPAIQQRSGLAPQAAATPPPTPTESSPQDLLAQRAQTEGQPTQTTSESESPEERRLVVQMLLKRLPKLL